MTKNLKMALLAAAGMSAAAVSPAAAATFLFTPGASSSTAGFTIVNTFDNATGLVGGGYQIKNNSDTQGARPANSNPGGTPYLSVLGGGTATYTFSGPVSAFQFDWGSIDRYNTLRFTSNQAGDVVIPGSDFTNTAANGNQVAAGTNGLFTVTGAAGEVFTSVTFQSTSNSFEVDNLAVRAVPEPASWAMMIGGFGLVGGTLRRRKAQVRTGVSFA